MNVLGCKVVLLARFAFHRKFWQTMDYSEKFSFYYGGFKWILNLRSKKFCITMNTKLYQTNDNSMTELLMTHAKSN